MARQFKVPSYYQSPIVSRIKDIRRQLDPRKKDLSPTLLDFGPVQFRLARHFGFCYGVENAIEIAYRAIEENPGKKIYLLSDMIHNPHVNRDLESRGILFLRTTLGEQLIPFSELTSEDVVIIPAFGTTVEIKEELTSMGVDIQSYNTTCPFVEKVWRHSDKIGKDRFTVVLHGKRYHEETRATFSHARQVTNVVVIRDMDETEDLARIITGDMPPSFFFERFPDRYSPGFNPETDLVQIGVVNQTTMLATETTAIAVRLRTAMLERYGSAAIEEHFADTSDTLCYATNENQDATRALIEAGADAAVIVGGADSSNTSHLVELCAARMPTFFVSNAAQIGGAREIVHFDVGSRKYITTRDWIKAEPPVTLLLTAGASCPDVLLDEVIQTICATFDGARTPDDVLADYTEAVL